MFLVYLFIFIFGALVGSFLNCLIYRLEIKKSPFKGRSFCPKCKHQLGFWDLIPVFSFIFLRGKCRYCQKKISWQYPIVEIAAGTLFVLLAMRSFALVRLSADGLRMTGGELSILNFKFLITALYLTFLTSALIVIFVYDLKHYIIPDKIIYPAIVLTLFYRIYESLEIGHWSLIGNWSLVIGHLKLPLLAAVSATGFFFLIWAVSRGRWLGFGDVKLAFLLGLLLGWPNILAGLFTGFLLGAIIGVGLMLAGKKGLKSQVPFGPFLVAGAFIGLFWGQQLVHWYLGLVT